MSTAASAVHAHQAKLRDFSREYRQTRVRTIRRPSDGEQGDSPVFPWVIRIRLVKFTLKSNFLWATHNPGRPFTTSEFRNGVLIKLLVAVG